MTQLDPEVLATYIEELGLEHSENSLSYLFTCPRCAKRILYMYKLSGYFSCMKCTSDGFKGSPEYALAELAGIPIGTIRTALYGTKFVDTTEKLELNLEDFFGEDDEFDVEIIPEISWKFDEIPIDQKHAIRGLRYLESRGIPLDIALKYHIRYAPARQRVLIPMKVEGKLVGHQGRLVVPNREWNEDLEKYVEAPKIISTDNFPNSRMVMFADNLKGSSHVIICEGPFDGIKFDTCCGGNIATTGKAVSKGQCNFIRSYGVKRIYLALDPNAYAETTKLIQEFSDLEVFVVKVPAPYRDFGEMSFDECLQAFKQAEPAFPGQLHVYFG